MSKTRMPWVVSSQFNLRRRGSCGPSAVLASSNRFLESKQLLGLTAFMGAFDRKDSAHATCTRSSNHRSPDALVPIYHLNTQALGLLIDSSRSVTHETSWSSGRSLGSQLCEVEPAGLEHIAKCPFLLIDAGFDIPNHWRRPDAETERIVQDELAFTPSTLQMRLENLARATCLLAWHLAQTDPIAARLTLGVTAQTASAISAISLTELQELSMLQVRAGWIRPRWHDRPDIWHRLIDLAKDSGHRELESVTGYGLQLFLRALLAEDRSL
jgi:hypothetical protein